MSTPCDCPLAGYCERHQRQKIGRIYELCRTDIRYFDLWERQANETPDNAKIARRARVKQAAQRTQRLIDWLKFFRLTQDAGLGDTAQRLSSIAVRSPDAKAAIARLMAQCNCKPVDAVARLNAEHPYPANTRNLGGS